MEQRERKYTKPAVCLLLILSVVFSAALFSTRTQPHVDEVWSYMLSNKFDGPFLYAHAAGVGEESDPDVPFILTETESYLAYFDHWHDGDYYKNALTVQPDERFSYAEVYHNQTLDVHPPLYYFLLHTICSFFPDRFSWWFAFGLNLAFYAGSVLLLFAVGKALKMTDLQSVLAAALWALSAAGTDNVVFLRMYMMLTFLTLASVYLHIRLINDFRRIYVAGIFLLNIAAFLTQYYAYIFAFFLTAFTVLFLLTRREFRRAVLYGLTVLASVGAAVAAFPAVFKHLFSSVYSSTAVNSSNLLFLLSLPRVLGILIRSFTGLEFSFLSRPYVLFAFPAEILLIYFIILLLRIRKREKISNITKENFPFLAHTTGGTIKSDLKRLRSFLGTPDQKILLGASLVASAVIIEISPEMGVLMVRYLFQLLPLFSVFFVMYVGRILRHAAAEKPASKSACKTLLVLLTVLLIVGSHTIPKRSCFLASVYGDSNGYAELLSDASIVFADGTHHSQAFAAALQEARRVYPTDSLDQPLAAVIRESMKDGPPLYLIVSSAVSSAEQVEDYLNSEAACQWSFVLAFHQSTDDPAVHRLYRLE